MWLVSYLAILIQFNKFNQNRFNNKYNKCNNPNK